MLDITAYSIFTTIIITSIFIIPLLILLKINFVLCNVNIKILILIILIINIRLLIPIEFLSLSKAINSFDFMVEFDKFVSIPIVLNELNTFQNNFTVQDLLCLIWFVGFIISLYLHWRSYHKLYCSIRYIEPTDNKNILKCIEEIKKSNGLKFKVCVLLNKKIKFPAETGYFNKIIFLTESDYSDKDLYFILMHEISHYALKTNWIKLFLISVSFVFWWNPIIRIFKNYAFYLLELYVDLYVTKKLNKNLKADYLSCLLKVYKSSNTYSYNFKNYINALTYNLEEKLLKKRFIFITKQKKSNLLISTLFFIILTSYIFFSFRFVIQPAYNPPANTYDMPDFNTENSYIIKKGEKYIYISSNDINTIPKVKDR